MRPSPTRQYTAWLCVFIFVMNTTVFAHAFVHCTDSDGSTRLEWMCAKDKAGHCDNACDSTAETEDGRSSQHSEPAPCDDEPVGKRLSASARELVHVGNLLDLPVAPAVIVIETPALLLSLSNSMSQRASHRAGAPGALRSLRTVVLLV